MVPVADAAQTLELIALAVKIGHGKFTADLPQLHIRNRGGIADARLGARLEFRGQAVRIPARHIGGLPAGHVAVTHNDILQRLVERRAQMNVTVCIRRTIVQNEQGLSLVLLHQRFINSVFFPLFQHDRLALGQTGLHGKFRFGKIQRLFVILSHGGFSLLYLNFIRCRVCVPTIRKCQNWKHRP